MKKLQHKKNTIVMLLIFVSLLTFAFLHPGIQGTSNIWAQEKANEDEDTKTQEEKIQDLKDRLATKVAEIRESQKGAVSGVITELKDDKLALTTKSTEFSVNFTEDDTAIEELVSGKTRDRTIGDLENDAYITVFGLVNEDAEEIDASQILIKQHIGTLTGVVTEIDSKNFTVNVQTIGNELFTVDFESSTRTTIWDGEEIVKSGFSEIVIGDRIHLRVLINADTDKRVTATRALHLPDSLFDVPETNTTDDDEEIPEVDPEAEEN